MKICKRLSALILCLMVVLLIPVSAGAMGNIDMGTPVSLTLKAQSGTADPKTPVAGMRFDVYLISTVDHTGELTVTDTYKGFDLDIRGENDDAWKAMAGTLSDYITENKIKSSLSAETDKSGLVSFPGIDKGLYLVMGQNMVKDGYVYSATPFFVMLPSQDEHGTGWVYAITANPKIGVKPVLEDFEVIKIWKDEGHENLRPREITVTLLCDGVEYDTVILSKENNWKYIWENLDTNYTWTVVEARVPGYNEPEVQQDGNTFTVTNTYTTPGKPPKLPQTGQLWWPVPVLIAAGLFFVLIGLLCRKGSQDER